MSNQQTLELIDIYDISYAPWWLSSAAKYGLLCFIFVCGVLVGYLIYKKTRKPKAVPYWQQALDALDALEKQGFDDVQEFYIRLTEIMKQYLQEKYEISCVDKTDSELLALLKVTPSVELSVFETIKELFDGVIFIKFAHQTAAKERMEVALTKSRGLIREQVLDQPNQ